MGAVAVVVQAVVLAVAGGSHSWIRETQKARFHTYHPGGRFIVR